MMPSATARVPGPRHSSNKRKNGAHQKPPAQTKKLAKSLKRKREFDEVESLKQRVQDFAPETPPSLFKELPLTRQTAAALDVAHFKTLTDIQKRAIPLALKGRDVLGAAKTGSGKTLAFLIPMLEVLYRNNWTSMDGVGALIISPTRELATQIFEVLRKVGGGHTFSAGLVIGGKGLKEEQDALHRMNIVVCTPGRMLQHMDQTVGLNFDNLQMLVLDEADRCLDMGFKHAVDAIVENLPKDRQTLLFSATQTKNVSDLARLSLKGPEYVAVHETATAATPAKLEQFYMVVTLPEKLDTLFSFLRNHLTSKVIVFMSSCKQVRFVHETFRQLHIGIPVLHLHGKQKQTARADVAAKFLASKNSCLFSTDVIARGLDFPAVDWVIQIDAPEDVDTYIHRVGRTARFEKTGRALLFLCPNEEAGVVKRLEAKKVPIVHVNPKANKKTDIKQQLQGLCFKDPELKYLGQKAFVSYARSISVQKDKESFRLEDYPFEDYASSLGLPGAPRIKGIRSADPTKIKEKKNLPRGLRKLEEASSSESEGDSDGTEKPKKKKEKEVRTKYDRMVERQNQNILAEHYHKLIVDDKTASGDEDDFLKVKSRDYASSSNSDSEDEEDKVPTIDLGGKTLAIDSNRRAKLLLSKKELAKRGARGTKIVFDDDGEAHAVYELVDEEGFKKDGDASVQRDQFLREEEEKVAEQDVEDRALAKEKKRAKKEKRKQRERKVEEMERAEKEEERTTVLEGLRNYVPPLDLDLGDDDNEEGGMHMEPEREMDEDDEEQRPKKKKSKKSKDKKKSSKRLVDIQEESETLEDLEALASGLLA